MSLLSSEARDIGASVRFIRTTTILRSWSSPSAVQPIASGADATSTATPSPSSRRSRTFPLPKRSSGLSVPPTFTRRRHDGQTDGHQHHHGHHRSPTPTRARSGYGLLPCPSRERSAKPIYASVAALPPRFPIDRSTSAEYGTTKRELSSSPSSPQSRVRQTGRLSLCNARS